MLKVYYLSRFCSHTHTRTIPIINTLIRYCLPTDQQWLCDPSSIQFGESIGEGQFGDVFRGVLSQVSTVPYYPSIPTASPYRMENNQSPLKHASQTPRKINDTNSYKRPVCFQLSLVVNTTQPIKL